MSPKTKPRRVDGYIRVSQVGGRGGETFISPEVQREKIEAWANYKSCEIGAIHEELDVSGRKASRPKLDAMMERIRSGETDGVVVWKCSRFGRNLLNSLELIRELEACEATFASATEDFDTSTSMGRLVMHIMLALAEDESEGLREGWLEAQTRAWRERGALPGTTPLGYKRGEGGRLEVDHETADAVVEAYRLIAAEGPHAALEYLQGEVPERLWNMTTLHNLVGLGTRRVDGEQLTAGERAEFYVGNGRYRGERSDHAPDAIMDLATYTRARQALADKRPRSPNKKYPFAHMIRCTSCNGPLVGSVSSSRMYRCFTRDCPRRTMLSAGNFEKYSRQVGHDRMRAAEEEAKKRMPPGTTLTFSRLANPTDEGALREIESAIRSEELAREEDAANLDLAPELLMKRDAARAQKIAALQERLEALVEEMGPKELPPMASEFLTRSIEELPTLFQNAFGAETFFTAEPGKGKIEQRVALHPGHQAT
jgi:DNA invertase Pin-like site-specific DNA recombinase